MVSARLGSVFDLPRRTTSGNFRYCYDLFTELRSLLENEANWYQSKKYCESQGLTLSEVEPGDGPDGILADYYRRRYGGIWSLKWTQSVTKSISAKTLTVCKKSVGTMLECLTLRVIWILPHIGHSIDCMYCSAIGLEYTYKNINISAISQLYVFLSVTLVVSGMVDLWFWHQNAPKKAILLVDDWTAPCWLVVPWLTFLVARRPRLLVNS